MELTDKIGSVSSLLTELDKVTQPDATVSNNKSKSKRGSCCDKFYVYDGDMVVGTTKSPAQETTRRFFLRTYIDVAIIDKYLKTCPWVDKWAYCLHDKDKNEKGELKARHTHIALYTYDRKTSSAIQKKFDRLDAQTRKEGAQPEKTEVEIMRDTCTAWRYLRHLDNPEKFQYSECERIANDKSWWNKYERTDGMNDTSRNLGLAMFTDRLNGATVLEMTERYGKEWLYHQKHIDENIRLHLCENRSNKSIPFDRQLLDLILNSSNFSRQDIAIFNTILGFVQRDCIEHYGSPIDLYFREDKEKNA